MNKSYICPVCAGELAVCGKSHVCSLHHTFDIAKEGYVNLAVGKSGDSGDSREMCLCRHRFLNSGYYAQFADGICDCIGEYLTSPGTIIDAGCGEGYYLRRIKERFPESDLFGIDLAKEAIKLAAKSERGRENPCHFSVCGIFSLPFSDEFADAVISVFAPVCESENARVLKKGGIMLVAGPGKTHLSGLKSAIYESPYENPEKHREYEGFIYVGSRNVKYETIIEKEHIYDLFTMTPYYWKTSKRDAEKLASLETLSTELDFVISVYRKL